MLSMEKKIKRQKTENFQRIAEKFYESSRILNNFTITIRQFFDLNQESREIDRNDRSIPLHLLLSRQRRNKYSQVAHKPPLNRIVFSPKVQRTLLRSEQRISKIWDPERNPVYTTRSSRFLFQSSGCKLAGPVLPIACHEILSTISK